MATSRPFAYNTGSTLPYTEQVGDIAIGTGGVEYAANYGGLKWWGGPDEDLGYVITHTVPAGNQPNPLNVPAYLGFWRSPSKTEQSFVDYTNFIFGTSFTTGNDCKTYLNNNGYWTSYVTQSNLKLHLDASDPNSYSGAGTTWYDLSSSGNDVQMNNSGSISWVNTGATYFSTGSNGWFSNPSGTDLPTGNSPYTLITWVQLGSSWSSNGFMSIGPFGIGNQSNAFRAGTTNQFINYWWGNDLAVVGSVSPTTSWFNAVAKFDGTTRSILVNGVLIGSDTPGGSHNVTTSALQIAKTYSNEYLNGNIGEVLIYDTALSDSDILQYYNDTKSRYEGPATSGLTLSLDAGNSSSYPGTGSTWTNLVGGSGNATLINSPTYNSANSGYLNFSKTSLEYATVPNIGTIQNWTVEVWVRFTSSLTGQVASVVGNQFNLSSSLNFSIGTNNAPGSYNIVAGFFQNGWYNTTGFAPTLNTWYQIVGTYDGSTIKQYVNGTASGGTLNVSATLQSGGEVRMMKRWDSALTSGNLIDGDLSIVRIYNRALNATEITQNYNANKSRFGL